MHLRGKDMCVYWNHFYFKYIFLDYVSFSFYIKQIWKVLQEHFWTDFFGGLYCLNSYISKDKVFAKYFAILKLFYANYKILSAAGGQTL